MNLFGIGTGELLVIVLIMLLVMGPERLGEVVRLVRQASGLLRYFRNAAEEFNRELNRELNLDDIVDPPSRPQRSHPVASSIASADTNTIAPPSIPQTGQPQDGSPASPALSQPLAEPVLAEEQTLASEPTETDHG